jgi:type IV secretion system protein VirD4
LYFLTQNIIRFITRSPWWSLFEFIFATEQKGKPPATLLTQKPQGFIFGNKKVGTDGNYFFKKSEDTDGHILIVGGAGSYKSSCIAVPSILSWKSRIFAIDIKGELSQSTAHKGAKTKIFNPMNITAQGYDPYYLLRNSDNPAQDAREIALALIQTPVNAKDPFWVESAQNLLTGIILHCNDLGFNFIETVSEITDKPIDLLVKYIAEESRSEDARRYINQFVTLEQKTLAGIFAELSNNMMIFATDKKLKICLSKEDNITPQDLEDGYDVFLSIPEDKIDQWKNLLTLITNQFLKHFERREDKNATPVLFLLDEFPRLGKVETIETALATLRSKKITICLIIQSLAQLDALYGTENRRVILDNCVYKAILNATDADTQEYFSRLVGTYEKKRQGHSANFEHYTGNQRGYSVTENIIDSRVIKPEDFATLTNIVMITQKGTYRIDKATPYYERFSLFNERGFKAWSEKKTMPEKVDAPTSKIKHKTLFEARKDTQEKKKQLRYVKNLSVGLVILLIGILLIIWGAHSGIIAKIILYLLGGGVTLLGFLCAIAIMDKGGKHIVAWFLDWWNG